MPSNFFGHLKRALELFISVRMSPLATLWDHLVDTMTPGEKTKRTNTHPCLAKNDLSSGKKYEIPHFCRLDLEIFSIGFSDTLNAMV